MPESLEVLFTLAWLLAGSAKEKQGSVPCLSQRKLTILTLLGWEAVVNNGRASTCLVACGNSGGGFTVPGRSQPKEQCHHLGLILLPGCTQMFLPQRSDRSGQSGRAASELLSQGVRLDSVPVLRRWSGAVRKAKASPHIADASPESRVLGTKGSACPAPWLWRRWLPRWFVQQEALALSHHRTDGECCLLRALTGCVSCSAAASCLVW